MVITWSGVTLGFGPESNGFPHGYRAGIPNTIIIPTRSIDLDIRENKNYKPPIHLSYEQLNKLLQYYRM